VSAGAGEQIVVGAGAGEEVVKETGEKAVAGSDGVDDGGGEAGLPGPVAAGTEESGAARSGGDEHEGAAVPGVQGEGVVSLGAGLLVVAGAGEAGGFVGVEF
jgi:hypothetical protein